MSQVSLWGEQPKHNVAERDVMFVLLFLIPCLVISFVFMKPSLDAHINLSHVP